MSLSRTLIRGMATALLGIGCAVAGLGGTAGAQAPNLVQPWGLPPLPAGVGPVEKFADVSGTPQGQFLDQSLYLEGATSGTFWRFKAPYPGLIGPGGVRLPAQP
jgi:hypothetical protein